MTDEELSEALEAAFTLKGEEPFRAAQFRHLVKDLRWLDLAASERLAGEAELAALRPKVPGLRSA